MFIVYLTLDSESFSRFIFLSQFGMFVQSGRRNCPIFDGVFASGGAVSDLRLDLNE